MLHTQLVGAGRPRVGYLHGLFGRGTNWNGIARALAAEDQPGVLIDLPNHGHSPWTPTFDYLAMADAVAAEIEERMGSAAGLTLVGHSMGGKVAMLVALRAPHLVKGLVVVDIAPGVSAQVVTSVPLVAAMRALDLTGTENRRAADAAMALRVDDPAVRQFLLQNLKLIPRVPAAGPGPRWRWGVNLDLLGDSLAGVASWPEISGSYPGDVLWVAGAESPYIQPEHEPAMRALFPNVRQVTIAGAGHWVHADQPDALVAALRGFLSRPSPR